MKALKTLDNGRKSFW